MPSSVATTTVAEETRQSSSSSSQPLSPRRRAAAVVKKTREQNSSGGGHQNQVTSPRAAAAALAVEQKKSRTNLAKAAQKLSSRVVVANTAEHMSTDIEKDMEATSQALAKMSKFIGAAAESQSTATKKKQTKSRTVASYSVQEEEEEEKDDADSVVVLAGQFDKNGEAREPSATLRETKTSTTRESSKIQPKSGSSQGHSKPYKVVDANNHETQVETREDHIKVIHRQPSPEKATASISGSGMDALLHMASTGNFDGLQKYEEKASNTDPSAVAAQEPKTMGSMDELQERKDTFDSQESDDLDEDGNSASPDILSKISAFIDKVEKKNHAKNDTKNHKSTSSRAGEKLKNGSNKSYDYIGTQDVSSNFNIDDLTKLFDEPISPRKRRAASGKKKAEEKGEEKKPITGFSSTIVKKMPSTDENRSLDPKESLSTVEDLPSLCSSSMGDSKNKLTTTLEEVVSDTHNTLEKNLAHAQDATSENAPVSVDMKHNNGKSSKESRKADDPVCQIRGDLSPRLPISPTSTRCSRGSDPGDSFVKRLPIEPGQAVHLKRESMDPDPPERGSDPPAVVDPDKYVRPREDPPEAVDHTADEVSCHEAEPEETKIETTATSPKEESAKKAPKAFSPRPRSGPPKPELMVSPRAEKTNTKRVLSAETGAESAPINLEDDGVEPLVVDLTQVNSDVVFNATEIQSNAKAVQEEGAEVDLTDHFASLEKLLTVDNSVEEVSSLDEKSVLADTLSVDTESINNKDKNEAGFKAKTSPPGVNVEDTAGFVFEAQGGDAFERVLSSEENPLLPHLKKSGVDQCPGGRLQPPGDYSDDAVSDNEDNTKIDKDIYQDSSPIKSAVFLTQGLPEKCTSAAMPVAEDKKDPLQSILISRENNDEDVPCEQIEIGLSFVQLTLNEVKSFVDANDEVSRERLQELERLDKKVPSLSDLADATSTVEEAYESPRENHVVKTEDTTEIEVKASSDDLTPSTLPVSTFKFDPNQKPPLYSASDFPGSSTNPFLKSRDHDDDSSSKGVKRKFSTELDEKLPGISKRIDSLGNDTLEDQKAGQDNFARDNSATVQKSSIKIEESDTDDVAPVPSPRAVVLSASHHSEKDSIGSISLNISSCSDDDNEEPPVASDEVPESTPWKAAPVDVVESFSFGVNSESTMEEPHLIAAELEPPAHDTLPTLLDETCTSQQVPIMANGDKTESQDQDEGASKKENQVQETPSAAMEQDQDNKAQIEDLPLSPEFVEAIKTTNVPEDAKDPEAQKFMVEINGQETHTDEKYQINLSETDQCRSAVSPAVSPTASSPVNVIQNDVQEKHVLSPSPSDLREVSPANSKNIISEESPEGDALKSLEDPPVVTTETSIDTGEQTSVYESPIEKAPRQPTGWDSMVDLTHLDDEDGSSEQESVNAWEVTALKVAPWEKTTEDNQHDDPVVLDEAITTPLETSKEDQTPRAHKNKRFDFIQEVDESENISAYFSRMAILKKGGHLPSFNTQAMASFEEKMNLDDNEDCVEVDIDVGFVQKALAPVFSNGHNSWDDDEPGELSRYVSIEEGEKDGARKRFPKNTLLETTSDEDVFSKLTDHDTSGNAASDPPTSKTSSYDGREDESIVESIHAPILVESSSSGLAAILDEQFDADPAPLGMTMFRESASYESGNNEWLRKHDLATRKTQQPTKSWLTRTASELQSKLSFVAVEKPKAINGVAAAKKLSMRTTRIRGGRRRNPIPSTGAWKLSYKERTKGHPGYFDVDFFSLFECSAVGPFQPHRLDDAPWEGRDTRQHFLHDRSISLSKNWFGTCTQRWHQKPPSFECFCFYSNSAFLYNLFLTGKAQRTRGNDRVKQAVSRPKSMEMPMENKPHPEEWTGEWYKTWKKPEQGDNMSQSIESSYSGSGASRSGTEGSSTHHDSDVASSTIEKSGSHISNHTGSIYSGSYSTRGAGSSRSSYAESSDPDDYTYVDDDDAPQCGTLTNVKPNIGERVTRIHPDYTSQLRRSRWRMKYFPRGSFPYEK